MDRKRFGVYYTPPALVDFIVHEVVAPACDALGCPPRVVDPACGDGRLLAAAGVYVHERFGVDTRPFLTGVEIDPVVAGQTAARLGIDVRVGDGRCAVDGAPFDVVIGNPPYLSQLSSTTTRGGRSSLGGGPYADAAAEFLAASLRLARHDGGRVGLVLPLSVLATRDVGPIRASVEQVAAIDLWWWTDKSVFDANVRTGIIGLVVGGVQGQVRRFTGPDFDPLPDVVVPRPRRDTWSWLVADLVGIPRLDQDTLLEDSVQILPISGVLGDLAVATADFRDQYYGLIGAVSDDADGAPLITSGLIDPGECHWGVRPVRFAKQRFAAPRVDLAKLTPKLQAWARSRLVPKVLVASQTRIIEAVVDEMGEWLPSVPVVSVIPHDRADVWRIGALLTSPTASAWLAQRRLGSGLSASSIRVTASDLARIALPDRIDAWAHAADSLRRGDVDGCAATMLDAVGQPERTDVLSWWVANCGAKRR